MCLIDLDDVKNRKWCPPIDSTVKIFTFFVKPCPQILSPTMSKENIMKLPNFQTFFKMPVSRIDKFSKGRVQKKKLWNSP